MKKQTNSVDRTILELQGVEINRIIEDIDKIFDILQEQQEAIAMLERCVITLQRIILKERES